MKLTRKLRNYFLNTGVWGFGATGLLLVLLVVLFARWAGAPYKLLTDWWVGIVLGIFAIAVPWLRVVRRRVRRDGVQIAAAAKLGFDFEGRQAPLVLACSTCWSETHKARMNDQEYEFCFGCGRTTCSDEGVRDAAAVVDEYAKDPERKGRELAIIQHTKDRERIAELLEGIEASRAKMRIDLAELDRIPGGSDAYQLSRPQGYRIADDKRLDPNDVPAQTALDRLVDHLTDETRTEPIRVVVQTHDTPLRRGKRST